MSGDSRSSCSRNHTAGRPLGPGTTTRASPSSALGGGRGHPCRRWRRPRRAGAAATRAAGAPSRIAAPVVVARSPISSAIAPCTTLPIGYSAPISIMSTLTTRPRSVGRRAELGDRGEARQRAEVEERRRRRSRRPRAAASARARTATSATGERAEHAQQDASRRRTVRRASPSASAMHTAPTPCAVTSAAVPNFSSSNTFERDRRDQRDERRREQRVERHAPDDEPQRGVAAHEPRALADRVPGSTRRRSASAAGAGTTRPPRTPRRSSAC